MQVLQRGSAENKSGMMLRKITTLVLLLLMLSGVKSAQGQNVQTPKNDSDTLMICRYILILVEVSVTDRGGEDIGSLRKEHFVIYENGRKQYMESCERVSYTVQGKLRVKYKLLYPPFNDLDDGTRRKIKVRVNVPGQKKARVSFSPKSYVAAAEIMNPR